jgi:hypothetical protein
MFTSSYGVSVYRKVTDVKKKREREMGITTPITKDRKQISICKDIYRVTIILKKNMIERERRIESNQNRIGLSRICSIT